MGSLAKAGKLFNGKRKYTPDQLLDNLADSAAIESKISQAAADYEKYSAVGNADNSIGAAIASDKTIHQRELNLRRSEGASRQVGVPIEDVPASSNAIQVGSKITSIPNKAAATAPSSLLSPLDGVIKTKSVDRVMLNQALKQNKGLEYAVNKKIDPQFDSFVSAARDDTAAEKIGEQLGIKDLHTRSVDDRIRLINNARTESISNKLQTGPSTAEKMWGNKIPQKAAGALITANVVSSLSNSRGQQTNAQLYGQAPGPGIY